MLRSRVTLLTAALAVLLVASAAVLPLGSDARAQVAALSESAAETPDLTPYGLISIDGQIKTASTLYQYGSDGKVVKKWPKGSALRVSFLAFRPALHPVRVLDAAPYYLDTRWKSADGSSFAFDGPSFANVFLPDGTLYASVSNFATQVVINDRYDSAKRYVELSGTAFVPALGRHALVRIQYWENGSVQQARVTVLGKSSPTSSFSSTDFGGFGASGTFTGSAIVDR